MGRGIRVLAGTVAVGIGGLGAYKLYVDHDMKKYRRSETHTQDTALKHYMVQRGMGFIGRRFAVNLETDTADVESVQRGLLVSLLRRYQTTEYGKQHRLVDIGDRDVFLARHPLTQYKDYEAHMDRVCDGETHALVPEKSDLKVRLVFTASSVIILVLFACPWHLDVLTYFIPWCSWLVSLRGRQRACRGECQ